MKYAKKLKELAVPEWRPFYFDYKKAKKKVKALTKALKSKTAQQTAAIITTTTAANDLPGLPSTEPYAGPYFHQPTNAKTAAETGNAIPETGTQRSAQQTPAVPRDQTNNTATNNSNATISKSATEDTNLSDDSQRSVSYGSINGTPPQSRQNSPAQSPIPAQNSPALVAAASLSLPGPAINIGTSDNNTGANDNTAIDETTTARTGTLRLGTQSTSESSTLENAPSIKARRDECLQFFDQELDKVERFYKEKEDRVKQRLPILCHQLEIMHELHERETSAKQNGGLTRVSMPDAGSSDQSLAQAERNLDNGADLKNNDPRRDYARKPVKQVSYARAKRQMKLALQTYYGELELIKRYALQNQEAFRKATKKFNKNVPLAGGSRTNYMNEEVKQGYFVTSEVIDDLLKETIDLYAQYFEQGDHKVAGAKLRVNSVTDKDASGSMGRASALLAAGGVLGIQGIVYAALQLFNEIPTPATRPGMVSYLLQIYGGYFLIVLLTLFFTICLAVFQNKKVNYQLIFQVDQRSALSWKELLEIPSWFFFMMGLTLYFNFNLNVGGEVMFPYWPVVLIGASVVLLCLPAPVFYHRARIWFFRGVGDLFFSLTLIPTVGFREFFFGDLLCSLTYAMGNIELLFCLYARQWNNADQCNSSHSRLMGFLAAFPSILRAFQCLRRFWSSKFTDTRQLGNFFKYCFGCWTYAALSLWRLNKPNVALKIHFIVSAICNSVFVIIWDIVCDWSLGIKKYNYLRKTLVVNQHWVYYSAIFIDVILRLNWILYAVYTESVQHSTFISFMVAVSEVARRGIWMFFRVENEQAKNLQEAKANEETPLPYSTLDGAGAEPVRSDSSSLERQTMVMSFLSRVGTSLRDGHVRDYERKEQPPDADDSDDDDDDE